MRRSEVPFMAAFKYNNSRYNRAFLALGALSCGKNMSLNLETGALASSSKDNDVQLVGRGEITIDLINDKARHAVVSRSAVEPGSVFFVRKGSTAKDGFPVLYAHLGTLDDGSLVSINTENRELAVRKSGKNPDVVNVGTFRLTYCPVG